MNITNQKLFSMEKRESKVNSVLKKIQNLLLERKLKPGERLPSEPELAESFNISRGSVREAMKILSAYGIVEIKRGDGTYIADSSSKELLNPLLFSLILAEDDSREMIELRKTIEEGIIKLIIKNASHQDLEELEKTHENFKKYVKEGDVNPEEALKYDIKFHEAMGKATNNKLMNKIYNYVLDFFAVSIKETHKKNIERTEENGEYKTLVDHENILEALMENEEDKALQALDNSIIHWERRIQK